MVGINSSDVVHRKYFSINIYLQSHGVHYAWLILLVTPIHRSLKHAPYHGSFIPLLVDNVYYIIVNDRILEVGVDYSLKQTFNDIRYALPFTCTLQEKIRNKI